MWECAPTSTTPVIQWDAPYFSGGGSHSSVRMWECLLSAFGSEHLEWRARRSSASLQLGRKGQPAREGERESARPPSLWSSRARTFRILHLTEWLYKRLGPASSSTSSSSPSPQGRTSPFSVCRAALGIKSPKQVQSQFVSVARALFVWTAMESQIKWKAKRRLKGARLALAMLVLFATATTSSRAGPGKWRLNLNRGGALIIGDWSPWKILQGISWVAFYSRPAVSILANLRPSRWDFRLTSY